MQEPEGLYEYWRTLFETESVEDTRPVVPLYPVKWNLVDPISMDEIS